MSEETADKKADQKKKGLDLTEKDPAVTQHKAGSLDYEAVTGWMPIKDEKGEVDQGREGRSPL
jgi:hypothetical protein